MTDREANGQGNEEDGYAHAAPFALLITRNFPPLLGGMEKVNQHLLAALRPAWRVALCGPAGCAALVPTQAKVRQSRIRPLAVFLMATLWRSLQLARTLRPSLVLAGSGLTAPIAWLVARCVGARVVVYLHGLDIVAPNFAYQRLWLPFIRRCDIALVNSSHTAQLASFHGVQKERMHVLHPGTDLPVLDPAAGRLFRESAGLGQSPILLSVGRLTQRKGLTEFVTQALPAIVARYPDVLLLVIGHEANDALHGRNGSERERILAAAKGAGTEGNIRFLGRCDDQTLHAAYQAANLHVFPVLDLPGDVEGFGMVALEAAAHALPTVGFSTGGVPDAVEAGRTGTLVDAGDYAGLSQAVIQHLELAGEDSTALACREFAAQKAWPVFGMRLRGLLGAQDA